MSTDIKEISSVLEESTGNINVISSAVGELTNTVTEISRTSSQAHLNTENTKKKMKSLEKDVHELRKAGEDITVK